MIYFHNQNKENMQDSFCYMKFPICSFTLIRRKKEMDRFCITVRFSVNPSEVNYMMDFRIP